MAGDWEEDDVKECQGPGCTREVKAKATYCSASCRAKAWRDRHIPHCPGCGIPLGVSLERSNGQEGA